MAVAEQKAPQTKKTSQSTKPQFVSLFGVVYLLAALWVVFQGLPWVWNKYALGTGSFGGVALLGLVMILAIVVLARFGSLLLGAPPKPGVKAGVFVAFLFLLIWALLSRWIGGMIEGWTYDGFLSGLGTQGGIGIFVITSLAILFLFARIFFRDRFTQRLIRLEEHGWFTAKTYKPGQGLRVRRGTVLGILLVAGSGIWALINSGLQDGSWTLGVPFTTQAEVTDAGSAVYLSGLADTEREKLSEVNVEKPTTYYVLDREQARELNQRLQPNNFYLVMQPNYFNERLPDMKEPFKKNEIVSRDRYDQAVDAIVNERAAAEGADKVTVRRRVESDLRRREAVEKVKPLETRTHYAAQLTLLPDVKYTLPLVLIGLALWLAWRVINLPVFADFLIATEAEMNKVSWSTRPQLVRDTIVVLIAVFLFSVYFFGVDTLWAKLLSMEPISVLKLPKEGKEFQDANLKW